MARRLHFPNLGRANRWRRRHKRWKVKGVDVVANKPHNVGPSTAAAKATHVIAFAHTSLSYAGKMYYTMTSRRSELFHRPPGQFLNAHADCSQYCAALLHWVGVTKVSDTDATGTLLQKGKRLSTPKPGCVVIFGAAPGEHAAFITENTSGTWWTIGFGHQGAPNRVPLSVMENYFRARGHSGVTFLDFYT